MSVALARSLRSLCVQTDGLPVRTIPAVLGYGALTAVMLGVFDYTGGSFNGSKAGTDRDEFEHKEWLRKNKRRPIQEVLDDLGEGRGMPLLSDLGGKRETLNRRP